MLSPCDGPAHPTQPRGPGRRPRVLQSRDLLSFSPHLTGKTTTVTGPCREPADLSALSDCAEELADAFVSLASDIALVIDERGVITRVAQSAANPMAAAARWVGRPWVDTVTGDTRRKVERLLADAGSRGPAQRREVNHDAGTGTIPFAYTALRLGKNGPVLAVGRDLRAVGAIQQRFVDTQQELERAYWQARQADVRHGRLVQVATDAVLVVDADSLHVVDADAAAGALLSAGAMLQGRPAVAPFEEAARAALHDLLVNTRASGRPAEIHARLAGDSHAMVVSAAPFRGAHGMRLLLRVRPLGSGRDGAADTDTPRVRAWRAERLREAVVVTDSSGRVLVANAPFLMSVQAAREADVRGRPLADWLGRDAAEMAMLIGRVQLHGIAQQWRASLRRGGTALEVDVTATLLADGEQACCGITIRPCDGGTALPAPEAAGAADFGAAMAALAAGVGSVPLARLLQEAQQLVQQQLAQAALQRCAGSGVAAAALLGVGESQLALWLTGARGTGLAD
jgi:transcriptional regulator PpsR